MAERGSLRDRRRQHWLWIDHAVVDHYAAKIGPHALAVYVYLVRRANSDDSAWPSIKTICEALGMGRTKAKESLTLLEDYAIIGVTPRVKENGDPDSNLYTIMDVPEPGVGRHTTGGRSPHDHEEYTGKNNQVEEGTKRTTSEAKKTSYPQDSLIGFEDLKDKEKSILEVLQSIPYFPSPERTIPKIRECSAEWPSLDGLEISKDYRAYCEDKRKKPSLLQLRNFYKQAAKNKNDSPNGEGYTPGRREPRKVI